MSVSFTLSQSQSAAFCGQLGMILKTGISPLEGLAILMEDCPKGRERDLYQGIYDRLLETGSLAESLENSGAFPAYLCAMVRLGEQAGRLDQVMESLARYYQREADLAKSLRQAVAYPSVMVVMLAAVILILITQVLPIFDQVFQQLGTEMTGLARGLLVFGEFLRLHVLALLVVVAVVCALLCWRLRRREAGNRLSQLWAFGGLSQTICSYRFACGMALTLSSGLSPEEALNLSSELVPEGAFQNRLTQCKTLLSQGKTLQESLSECRIFSGIYLKMLSIAGKTGHMDEMMDKIAQGCEADLDERLSRRLSAIEPTLVVILSLLVGLILLSVMLPLIRLLSAL
jgi:type IV pilus assembly protein PilC